MKYRTFGRTQWPVSEIGYGMWGLAGWSGSDMKEVMQSLGRAIDLGCNFFDTAWAYGNGKSENILADILKQHAGKRLYVALRSPLKILPGRLGHRSPWKSASRLHTLLNTQRKA